MQGNKQTFTVGWGALDANGHMANTAYLDYSADCRMMYFKANGFAMEEMLRRGVGPVVKKDEIEYRAEFRMLEKITVELQLAGISEDGSRFRFKNIFMKEDGKVAAVVVTTAGWLDHRKRCLTVPPDELLEIIKALPHTDDFEEFPSSVAK